jgi:hypothetical protein
MSQTNIDNFCTVLTDFKRALLEKESLKSQNIAAVDNLVKILLDLYVSLTAIINKYKPFSEIEIPAVRKLFESVQPPTSPEEKEKMLYFAKLNLVTFPFTLDQKQLSKYPMTNTLEQERYSS